MEQAPTGSSVPVLINFPLPAWATRGGEVDDQQLDTAGALISSCPGDYMVLWAGRGNTPEERDSTSTRTRHLS